MRKPPGLRTMGYPKIRPALLHAHEESWPAFGLSGAQERQAEAGSSGRRHTRTMRRIRGDRNRILLDDGEPPGIRPPLRRPRHPARPILGFLSDPSLSRQPFTQACQRTEQTTLYRGQWNAGDLCNPFEFQFFFKAQREDL